MQPQLPAELWMDILDRAALTAQHEEGYEGRQRLLRRITLVSTTFRDLARPFLWRLIRTTSVVNMAELSRQAGDEKRGLNARELGVELTTKRWDVREELCTLVGLVQQLTNLETVRLDLAYVSSELLLQRGFEFHNITEIHLVRVILNAPLLAPSLEHLNLAYSYLSSAAFQTMLDPAQHPLHLHTVDSSRSVPISLILTPGTLSLGTTLSDLFSEDFPSAAYNCLSHLVILPETAGPSPADLASDHTLHLLSELVDGYTSQLRSLSLPFQPAPGFHSRTLLRRCTKRGIKLFYISPHLHGSERLAPPREMLELVKRGRESRGGTS
ncbi:hypothetical protein JCM10207_006351 [Rhodosporidiobolus poonsookiae]